MATVLVVAAHPDDEVLGCGATIARLKHEGWRAVLMLMTRGVTGRGDGPAADASQREEQARLAGQTRRAAEIVGFDHVESNDFPDNRMDTVSRADLAHAVAAIVEAERPDLVLTHHPGDYNWDHGRTFDAVMMGARVNPPAFAPAEVRTFEVLSSTERAWRSGERAFHPNCWVDVGTTIELKKQALRCYEGELRAWPHGRSPEAVEHLARVRGVEAGVDYAEAFHIVRSLR